MRSDYVLPTILTKLRQWQACQLQHECRKFSALLFAIGHKNNLRSTVYLDLSGNLWVSLIDRLAFL